jgi:hypothetical protein
MINDTLPEKHNKEHQNNDMDGLPVPRTPGAVRGSLLAAAAQPH